MKITKPESLLSKLDFLSLLSCNYLGDKTKPRGIRNNNPGNIDKGANWNGLHEVSLDKRFATFKAPEYGIRAMTRILRNYNIKYGIDDIEGIINRWAPPIENDTDSYVNAVAKSVGINKNKVVNFNDNTIILKILKSIIKHENGVQPYSDRIIMKGIKMESK